VAFVQRSKVRPETIIDGISEAKQACRLPMDDMLGINALISVKHKGRDAIKGCVQVSLLADA
jgi:hypothetical protein